MTQEDELKAIQEFGINSNRDNRNEQSEVIDLGIEWITA